ncbi:hypothetical protein LCGC14_0325810 [marine sediment metagenome]|uniref:Uncharacterized protein n=1 Tax=marine sediment metagenome TaxID=412755 RepID=A0A0F9THV7_9ZZZZ
MAEKVNQKQVVPRVLIVRPAWLEMALEILRATTK